MSIHWLDGRSYLVPNAGLGIRTGSDEPCLRWVGSDLLTRSEPGARPNPLCIRSLLIKFAKSHPGERAAQGNRSENQPLCTMFRLRRTRLFGGYTQFGVRP